MGGKKRHWFTRKQADRAVEGFEKNWLVALLNKWFPMAGFMNIEKSMKNETNIPEFIYDAKAELPIENIETGGVVPTEEWFEVYVMVGVAGAGKDTWIKENVPNLPVLSRDIVRKEIGLQGEKTVGTKAQEELVTKIINERMDDFLIRKQSFVVNNMHLVKKYRDAVKERVRPYGPKLIYVYVEAPTPEVNKIRRDGQIKPEEIDSMYRRLQKPRKEECDELIEWIQHNNPQRVIDELADILCPYCPWTLNEVSKPRIGTCEGSYCEEAYQRFYDTTKD